MKLLSELLTAWREKSRWFVSRYFSEYDVYLSVDGNYKYNRAIKKGETIVAPIQALQHEPLVDPDWLQQREEEK